MKYSKFIRAINCKVNLNEENTNLNPIFDNKLKKFDLMEYSKIKKFSINQLVEDECCICYENFLKCKTICMPFKCNHIICFSCFLKYCISIRKNNIDSNISNKVFCPLCREAVNLDWKLTKRICFYKDKIENKKIEFVCPSSISDKYLI